MPDVVITNGKQYRIISNQVGTPRLVIDSASGKVAESLEFDEFGVLEKQKGKPLIPFGFAGGLHDADTGLVKFGARDYDTEIGRWTAKEPLRFIDGTNLYAYVRNNRTSCGKQVH